MYDLRNCISKNEITDCNTCILYSFCAYDRTGICEAENSKNGIPAKCKFCELCWECPVDRGGECVREGSENIAKRSTIKPE